MTRGEVIALPISAKWLCFQILDLSHKFEFERQKFLHVPSSIPILGPLSSNAL